MQQIYRKTPMPKCDSLLLVFSDFFEIPKGLSQAKYTCNKPKLEDVRVVRLVRGSAEMFWKTSYAEK